MEDPADNPAPPSPTGLSKTPSWIMLGFLIGVLFMWTLDRSREDEEQVAPPTPAPPPVTELLPAKSASQPQIMAVEAVFSEYEQYAVWKNDTTQVVLWNPGTQEVIDNFEVVRVGGTYYFRTIPELTRPLLTHGVPDGLPIKFTETEESRQQWLKDVSAENQRAFSQGVINILGGNRKAPAATPEPAPPAQPASPAQPPMEGK